MQTLRDERTQAPSTSAITLKSRSYIITQLSVNFQVAHALLDNAHAWAKLSCRARCPALHEPRDPDTAFVKKDHRQAHRDEGKHIWRRGDDGGENEDKHDGVRPGSRHEFVGEQSKAHEHEHHHW